MHGNALHISRTLPPSQIFVWGPIDLKFGHMTQTNQRVTHKIQGMIAPREHELWISKVPHYKSMEKNGDGDRHVDSPVSEAVVKILASES